MGNSDNTKINDPRFRVRTKITGAMRTAKFLIFLLGISFANEDPPSNDVSSVNPETPEAPAPISDQTEEQTTQKLTFKYTLVIATKIEYSQALSDKSTPEYEENAAAVERVFETDLKNAGTTDNFSLKDLEATFEIVFGPSAILGKTQVTLDSDYESTVSLTTDLHALKSKFLETLRNAVVAATSKSDGIYIAKNARSTSLSGKMTSDTCHGVTSYISKPDDTCHCGLIRGMTYDNDLKECACNGNENFYWNEDESKCSCTADYFVDFDGKCRKVTESIEWTRQWTPCQMDQKLFGKSVDYGRRSNVIRKFNCEARSDATKSPWFKCDSDKIKEYEICKNGDNKVICADPRASYKPDHGICLCDDALFWTKYGCRTFPTNKSPAEAIIAQIETRLNAIISADEFKTIPSRGKDKGKLVPIQKSQKRKTFKYWNQAQRQARKANQRCGRDSRAANPIYPTDIDAIHKTFVEISATATTSIPDLIKLIKLFDIWSKQSLFECDESGYGNDPTDGVTDKNGAVCDKKNASDTFKCRLRFDFTNLFNQYSGDNPLSWS